MLKMRYQLLLVAAFVLAAYYPANFSGYSRIDDTHMVNMYQSSDLGLKNVIRPYANSQYYRPIPAASYLFDKRSFNLDPGLMHLENILFHLFNTILVFFLTRAILSKDQKDRTYLPMIAAALFGLHPINTESVNWISGRTDLLAGIFILSTTIFLIKYKQTLHRKYLILSGVGVLLGIFTKEVTYGFLPGAFLILNTRDDGQPEAAEGIRRYLNRILASATAAFVFFIMIRYIITGFVPGPIRMSFAAVHADPLHAMFILLRSFGFYVKKIFFPYPLNIYIQEIDPLYQIIGVPLVLLCIYIATRRTLRAALFTTGMLMIIPAFIVVFNTIAWAPYAERYLYIPSAFIIVPATLFLDERSRELSINLKRAVLTGIFLIMAVITFQRAYLWQNEAALFEDTIAKSQIVVEIRMLYGSLLVDSGDYEKALEQFTIARPEPSARYDARADLMIANIRYRQHRYDDSLAISEEVLARTGGSSTDAINWSIGILWAKLRSARSEQERLSLNRRLRDYHAQLLMKYNDPHILYSLGIISANLGKRTEAIKYFQQAGAGMRAVDPLKSIAMRKADKLSHIIR